MSAADLFKNAYDVDFRLNNTWLMIGKEPYYVRGTAAETNDAAETRLILVGGKNKEQLVRLGSLPLRAMTACPHGYFLGSWVARGPARHRFQGITRSSFWSVLPQGGIQYFGVDDCGDLLYRLANQPRIRPQGKRASGVLTRDVYINEGGQVFVRGRLRGHYTSHNRMEPCTEILPIVNQLLTNARLEVDTKSRLVMPVAAPVKIHHSDEIVS